MADTSKDRDELPEDEAARRRDEALKRALTTPPKPHDSGKGGKKNEPGD